jgi:hypothetical protein
MAKKRDTATSPATALAGFIGKFAPEHQRVIRSARRVLRRRLPTAHELVYDNYNFFVIGYSPTDRPSDTIVSLAAGASGVGLSFYRGATLPDPQRRLLGSGTQNRFIRLPSAAVLKEPGIEALIAAAVRQARVPLPTGGGRRLVIRSVSAKQRPRRRVPA